MAEPGASPPTRPGDLSALSRAARHAVASTKRVRVAGALIARGDPTSVDQARAFLRESAEEGEDGIRLLLSLGATLSDALPDPRRQIPLELLDTPDARRLLELLTEAQAVAERLDAARGRSVSEEVAERLLPGEPRGMDLAESVGLLVLRLRNEVYGPKGRD